MLDKTRKQKKSYVLLIICKRKTKKQKTKKSRCQADFTSLKKKLCFLLGKSKKKERMF